MFPSLLRSPMFVAVGFLISWIMLVSQVSNGLLIYCHAFVSLSLTKLLARPSGWFGPLVIALAG